jgi:hypothetical protein
MQRVNAPVHEILKAYLSEAFLDRPLGMLMDDPRWVETRSFITELVTFLSDFPRSGTWYHDSAVTAEVSLDILEKALISVEGVYKGSTTVEDTWLSKLVKFIGNMERWSSQDTNADDQNVRPTPLDLRDKAVALIGRSLPIVLGDYAENGDSPTWFVGKEFLEVCLDSINGTHIFEYPT